MVNCIVIKRNEKIVSLILNDIVKDNGVIAGGYARYVCSPNAEPISTEDIDIFSYSLIDFHNIEKRCNESKFNNISFIQNTSTAISYEYRIGKEKYKIQLIKPSVICGKIEDIISYFDFTVIRGAIALVNDKIITLFDDCFYGDEVCLTLKIKNIVNPVEQIFRITKYIEKGYKCPITELILLFEKYNEMTQCCDDYKEKLLNKFKSGLVKHDEHYGRE
jgi:hypothetical protein